MRTATARKQGGRKKATDGLGEALFVRVTPEMIRALDALAEELRDERGGSVSRADVVREILNRALRERRR